MKPLKLVLPVLISLFFAKQVQSQDLIIQYDFVHDAYKYFHQNRKGERKLIGRPVISRNYEVRVEVINLNPYIFMARCNWRKTQVEETTSTSGMSSMLPIAGAPMGLTSFLSALNMDQFVESNASRGEESLMSNAMAKLHFDNALYAYNRLATIETQLNRATYAAKKLKELKYNPYLPYDSMKSMAIKTAASCMDGRPISASAFLEEANEMSADLGKEYEKLLSSIRSFNSYYRNYDMTKGITDPAEEGLDQYLSNLGEHADMLLANLNSEIISEKMDALERNYEAIMHTPFTYTCNYMADGDNLSVDIEFFELSPYTRMNESFMGGGDAADTLKKIRTKSLNLIIQGDIKISTSIGLAFPTYFDKNQTYTNKDSIISGSAGNNFAPTISTFINFYPYHGRNSHWGGTFGVGIPIQNVGTGDMNFYLGLSSILGNSSKVVLSAGLAIGQLTMLDQGYKVGDKLPSEFSEVPTKKLFTTGGYFSLSFALGK